ncbi:MAG: multidrug effflux MFS transporter [Deltaproteobacteria bacterium]|jgi:DHA1 family bicyclomycin/chloramphenicol resistance-like MFS transporter|nr:multidrug effflux MFS transporter [Deltaproteobacteria bacterium]
MDKDISPNPYARSRSAYIKLVVLLGILNSFAPFSIDMYLAAFPIMAVDMDTSFENIQLTLSVFFFGLALGQLIHGPISDRFGRRRPLMVGLMIYLGSSLALVFIREIHGFLLFRFVQALGGCAGMVICRAVVRDSFDVSGSAKVLTVIMAVQTIGPVLAPVAGAYLLTVVAWGASFVFMTLLGFFALLATFFTLKETLPPENRLKQSPPELFKNIGRLFLTKEYICPALAGAVGNGSIFVFISASPYVLMNLYGLSATQYGFTFAVLSISIAVVSPINFVLMKRFSARQVFLGGLSMIAIFGTIASLVVAVFGYPGPVTFMILVFLSLMCLPLVVANSTALAMAGSGKMAGLASSLIGVMQFAMAALVSFLVGVFMGLVDSHATFLIALCGIVGFLIMFFFHET